MNISLKLILIALFISFTSNTQARLLERLEETTKYFVEKIHDSTFNTKEEQSKPIQDLYTFTHKFVMQIESEKHTTNINYFLNNSTNYIGSSIDLENNITKMISVIDMNKKKATMFMEINNQKTRMSIPIDLENMVDEAIEDNDVKIIATGKTKTILNYTCHEFKVTGKDYHGNIWVTKDADVTFGKSFYKAKLKNGLNQSWMSMVNGLTMEMNITNTSKRKEQNIIMKCIALEKEKLIIDGSEYKKMI